MTLSIKNGGYTYLITLDLMVFMSLWKVSKYEIRKFTFIHSNFE